MYENFAPGNFGVLKQIKITDANREYFASIEAKIGETNGESIIGSTSELNRVLEVLKSQARRNRRNNALDSEGRANSDNGGIPLGEFEGKRIGDSQKGNGNKQGVRFALKDTVEQDVLAKYGKTYRWTESRSRLPASRHARTSYVLIFVKKILRTNMQELKIKKNDAGQRLDKFITKTLDLPTSLLYKSIRLKKIKVNRKRAEIGMILNEGDSIQCFLPDSFFEKKDSGDDTLMRIKPKLDIVYEDENIMLLNKRPGVSVHEDEHSEVNTLITHILAYLFQKGEYIPSDEQSFTPALCNRIDRNTGGIFIASKNAEALRVMN